VAKFAKGDRVCALLVCNRWGVEFNLFVGTLMKVEKRGFDGKTPIVTINVDTYLYLNGPSQNQKPHDFVLDANLWKILPWNKETRAEIKQLRKACRMLNEMTKKVKAL
jgi:hypothetical protein